MHSEEERRASPRYPLKASLEYRVTDPELASAWVKGRTIDMSSDSVLLSAASPLQAGLHVEIRMPWPLHEPPDTRGQLVLQGVVSWVSEDRCAIRLLHREFVSVHTP